MDILKDLENIGNSIVNFTDHIERTHAMLDDIDNKVIDIYVRSNTLLKMIATYLTAEHESKTEEIGGKL